MSHEQPQRVEQWRNGYPPHIPPPATSPPTSPPAAAGSTADAATASNPFVYANSRATRHLCTGTYVDEDFQRQVLDEVYNEPRRAVAPSPGSDAASIALHAKQARLLSLIQSGVLFGLMLMFLCLAFSTALTVIVILGLWQLTVALVRAVIDTVDYLRGSGTVNFEHLKARFTLILVATAMALGIGFLIAASPIISLFFPGLLPGDSGSGLTTYDDPYSQYPTETGNDASGTALVLLVLLITLLTVAAIGAVRRLCIRQLRHGVGNTGVTDTDKSKRIRLGQRGNVVNYSGYSPFVGHGIELRTWQIALPLYPRPDGPARNIETDGPGFTVPQLISSIHSGLRRYVEDHPGFKRLPELIIADQAFVAGFDTVQPVHFMTELPQSRLTDDMNLIKTDPTLPVRHYLKCQVNSWDGEIVTTVFVNAAIQGETLYMEFASHVLPPTRAEYHLLDDYSETNGFAVFLSALRAAGRLPVHIGRSPVVLARALRDAIRAATRYAILPEEITQRQDSGARVSVRELGTDLDLHNYFQEHDAVKYTSILQTQILEHTVNFLDRFIDVSELRQRKDAIVNNTVVNQGNVYTASQTGPGFVGAQGPRSQGSATSKES